CTAHVTDDFCEVWAPTQGPDIARYVASRESGLSVDRIKINTTFIGGGFGRRLNQDYVAEAVAISRQVKAPVKVIWSREEDIRHDIFRPASYHRLRSEEHTSELQSREISYAVFCLKKKKRKEQPTEEGHDSTVNRERQ